MKKILLLVEGIADLVFLKDFIEVHSDYLYNSNVRIYDKTNEIICKNENGNLTKILVLGSKEALGNENIFKKITSEINKESYDYTVLILDADESLGVSKKLADKYVNDLGLSNSYLFPLINISFFTSSSKSLMIIPLTEESCASTGSFFTANFLSSFTKMTLEKRWALCPTM